MAKTHCKKGHEFSAENTRYQGHFRRCLTCERGTSRAYQKQRRIDHPEAVSALRQDSHARMRYGLRELAHRDELLAEQNNACAICGVTGYTWGKGFNKRWHVDHDHNNPEPNHRGVLCERCNLVLGVLEKVGLTRFISYLEKYT